MAWTPVTGTANYASGFSNAADISPYAHTGVGVINGSAAVDPFLNTSGTQDYTTYYQGGNGKSITPDPGNSGLSAPLAGGPSPYHE
jgi:hypothetical protein